MLKDVSKAVLGAIAAAALLLVVCLVIGAMWLFSWGSFSKATANFRGRVAKTNQINGNGNYRIAAYDHFYDLCATVQTDEVTLSTLLDEHPDAYKDIDVVMADAADLVTIRHTLRQILNCKGD